MRTQTPPIPTRPGRAPQRPRGGAARAVAGLPLLALALAPVVAGCDERRPVGERFEEIVREGDEPIEGIEEAAREAAYETQETQEPETTGPATAERPGDPDDDAPPPDGDGGPEDAP